MASNSAFRSPLKLALLFGGFATGTLAFEAGAQVLEIVPPPALALPADSTEPPAAVSVDGVMPPAELTRPVVVASPDLSDPPAFRAPLVDADQMLADLPLPPLAAFPAELAPVIDAEAALRQLALPAEPALSRELVAMPAAFAETLKARLAAPGLAASAEGQALRAAYEARAFAPLFVEADGLGDRAKALAARLALAGDDGLDAAPFQLTLVDSNAAEALADADFRLATAALAYARQASGGRLEANRLSALITVAPEPVAPEAALAALTGGADPAAVIESFNPRHEGFRRLRTKLADLRNRLATAPAAERRTQQRRVDTVLANMERWRWLTRDLGSTYIWVNIPGYEATILDGGATVHKTRVVVGKADTQTPLFSHEMETVVINPAWNVPPSIIKNEMAGIARRDPSYFARRGYQVIRNGRVVDAASVDWSNPGRVAVRQPPGDGNALGKLKFLFPNRHAVYLHDTPSKSLFQREHRAFSHGCVRVYQPSVFAEKVLGLSNPDDGWSQGRIEGSFGYGERAVKLKRKLPIHLVYFTAEVGDSGTLTLRDDVYGHDSRVISALGQAQARMAQAGQ